jgi:hypothetical protein
MTVDEDDTTEPGTTGKDDDEINNNNPDDLRQLGNHQFSQQNYEVAAHCYSQAIALLLKETTTSTSTSTDTDEETTPETTSLLLNLCNRSACYYQMELYQEAKQDAATAWNTLPQLSNVKAAYRLAKTFLALDQFEQAKEIIHQVIQIMEEAEGEQRTKAEHQQQSRSSRTRKKTKQHPHDSSSDHDNNNNDEDEDPKNKDNKEEENADNNIKTQRKAFEDLMKTLEKKQNQKNQGKESPPKISIRDFILQDELGFGNFSEIYKVTHKQTGKQFALKRINKKKAKDLG